MALIGDNPVQASNNFTSNLYHSYSGCCAIPRRILLRVEAWDPPVARSFGCWLLTAEPLPQHCPPQKEVAQLKVTPPLLCWPISNDLMQGHKNPFASTRTTIKGHLKSSPCHQLKPCDCIAVRLLPLANSAFCTRSQVFCTALPNKPTAHKSLSQSTLWGIHLR